ncbi:sulfotransferase [Microbulbifer thermotolerans]|uniref:sulfotransferase n=1 Tax=Microbulbifer thermotolerans TaxID=252514 RepID=UPI002248AC29|nr:sulfotransferase [Microbulbifer thermotolerans]MCX2831895.1 sulfotransferase [Microbulbifer thermotolerans]
MNKPDFVIGIGSQRAGSTLLHRILDECTDIFMHPVKELHYFDTLYGVRHQDVLTAYSIRQLDNEIDRLIKSESFDYLKSKKYKCFLRTNKILSSRKIEDVDYVDLYRPCLMGNHTVGEITPEYMILPEEGIKKMAEMLGRNTRILLITRDPLDRFISAFKLLKAYGKSSVDFSNFEQEIIDIFEVMPAWIEQQKQLNNYEKAYTIYSKYFRNVLKISYEDLISDLESTHAKLEAGLEIAVNLERYRKTVEYKINKIGETKNLSSKTLSVLREKLSIKE